MTHVTTTAAAVGDLVEVVGHRVGDAAWEHGRESLLYAGSDIVISHPTAKT